MCARILQIQSDKNVLCYEFGEFCVIFISHINQQRLGYQCIVYEYDLYYLRRCLVCSVFLS